WDTIEQEESSFLAREVEQVADEQSQSISLVADGLQEMMLVRERPDYIVLEQRRGVALNGCQRCAHFVTDSSQKRGLELIKLAFACHITQQQATPDDLPRFIIHVKETQVDGATLARALDLNDLLCSFIGLSQPTEALTIGRSHRYSADRIVECVDMFMLISIL